MCHTEYVAHQTHFLIVTDAAFLAREKARADAEYYTAAKFAEANRVKKTTTFHSKHMEAHSRIPSVQLIPQEMLRSFIRLLSPSSTAEAYTRVPGTDEISGHSHKQQDLLRSGNPKHVCRQQCLPSIRGPGCGRFDGAAGVLEYERES